MTKKKEFMVFVLVLLVVVVVLIAKNRLYVEGRDAKFWHDAYIKEAKTSEEFRNCVNAGTILGPNESYKSLLELVDRVRKNCN